MTEWIDASTKATIITERYVMRGDGLEMEITRNDDDAYDWHVEVVRSVLDRDDLPSLLDPFFRVCGTASDVDAAKRCVAHTCDFLRKIAADVGLRIGAQL